MIWGSFLAGLRVGVFTSATLIFISCVGGDISGGVSYVIFIGLTFFFSTAVATLFKLLDNYIMEDK